MEPPRSRPFTLCVYCGSRHGTRASYAAAARTLGRAVGERGWQLVYGGGGVGLMGEVADAALAAGARVIGVIPESLKRREVGHSGLHELQVVPTMHLRKQMMAARQRDESTGTLEELYEVWTWRQLGYHDQPLGLLNVEGYYDDLLRFMDRTVAEGFLQARQRAHLIVGAEPRALLDALDSAAARADASDDYTRI